MSLPQVSAPAPGNPHPRPRADTRLPGRWLLIARSGWIAAVALILWLFLISLPNYLLHLQQICTGRVCPYRQLTPNNAHALEALGLSVGGYAVLTLLLTFGTALVWFVTGSVLAWRKSNDWMALLVALLLVQSGASSGLGDYYTTNQAGYGWSSTLLSALGGLLLFGVFLLFPSGRFVPRWTGWLMLCFLLTSLPHQFFPDWYAHLPGWASLLGLLDFVGSVLLLAFGQIYRYRRISTPVQRQQTKWILFGFTLQIVVLLGGSALEQIFPSLNGSFATLVINAVNDLIPVLIPLAFAIAILRYQLWEIDTLPSLTRRWSMACSRASWASSTRVS